MSLQTTSSQTIGPYLHIGTTWLVTEDLTAPGVTGERVAIEGRVLDADRQPVVDAMVEVWQANAHGRYAHPDDTRDLPLEAGFSGFGRSQTDEQGRFRFTTIKPGRVPGADGRPQAPHLSVTIFMRGILKHLITRMYFPDDPANAGDAVLGLVPGARRATLIARATKPGVVAWEVILQGDGETVFFEC